MSPFKVKKFWRTLISPVMLVL
ncbi:hypothetical protein ZOSMA_13G00930 [Zostera marina]|uniref:Uncharacterized protein n=1 Tax=Zostera marina TaxID=29655 RepID=A0A0K9PXV8_ZOSMR|nr:hypothetical protein ZOSMA_13G00930 [Zostera marina]